MKKTCTRKKNPILHKDRISELPDEILHCIISLLTLRQAAATKTLSTRWRRLHAATGNVISLDYPFPLQLQELPYLGRKRGDYLHVGDKDDISEYITCTKHTLDSYKGVRVIKKFKADIPKGECLGKWLRFALSRETETIDIRIVYMRNTTHTYTYISPLSNLNSLKSKSLQPLPSLKCLKELCISGARVDREYINLLLSNFVALELLSLESPKTEETLAFYGLPEFKLLQLIISNFSGGCIVVVDFINLVSLRCYGLNPYDLHLVNAPKLVTVGARCATNILPRRICPEILCSEHAQLLRLELCIGLDDYVKSGYKLITGDMPHILRKLKHLEMNVLMDKNNSTHQLFPLIEACPHLEILEIKFLWPFKPVYNSREPYGERMNKVVKIRHLKTMRLSGYFGSVAELEFVLCVIKNAVNLKELLVEGRDKNEALIQPREIDRAFQHLKSVVPSSVHLILM